MEKCQINKFDNVDQGHRLGTYEPTNYDNIPTNHNDKTLRTYVNDGVQTSDINTVSEWPTKILEELSIKQQNDKLSSEQRDAFRTLIENNSDIFVSSLTELGTTDSIQHEIDTGTYLQCENAVIIIHHKSPGR